jgi:hypothetical protein
MTFDEKVKFLRALPLFKVAPIPEVRAFAFAVKETDKQEKGENILGKKGSTLFVLSNDDVTKITREYPDFEAKFNHLLASLDLT